MENAATMLFRMPGVAVDTVRIDDGGARTVHVVTDDPTAAACPACGVFSTSVEQYRTTRPKDLPYSEAPLAVRWRKAQYRCQEPYCPRKAFIELPPGARVTGRWRRSAARAMGAGQSAAGLVDGLPISWPTAPDAFVTHAAT